MNRERNQKSKRKRKRKRLVIDRIDPRFPIRVGRMYSGSGGGGGGGGGGGERENKQARAMYTRQYHFYLFIDF